MPDRVRQARAAPRCRRRWTGNARGSARRAAGDSASTTRRGPRSEPPMPTLTMSVTSEAASASISVAIALARLARQRGRASRRRGAAKDRCAKPYAARRDLRWRLTTSPSTRRRIAPARSRVVRECEQGFECLRGRNAGARNWHTAARRAVRNRLRAPGRPRPAATADASDRRTAWIRSSSKSAAVTVAPTRLAREWRYWCASAGCRGRRRPASA